MDRRLLFHLARAAYTVFVGTKSVDHLWGKPINEFDQKRAVFGYSDTDDPEWEHRSRQTFHHISLTVSAFIINGLIHIFGRSDEHVNRAISSLAKHKQESGAYWSSYTSPTSFRGVMEPNLSPRHTASGLQAYLNAGRNPPHWNRSIEWLLANRNSDHGWGASLKRVSDCDSTAAVIHALYQWRTHNDHSELDEASRTHTEDGVRYLSKIYRIDPDYNEINPAIMFKYLGDSYKTCDTCYVIMNIVPLLNAVWLGADVKACIRQWIYDLNAGWNADGSLGQDEPMALANTVWGLALLTQIQTIDHTLAPALHISRAAAYLEKEFSEKSHVERIGLIEWGLLALTISYLFQAKIDNAGARQISNAYKDCTDKGEARAFRIVDALPKDCVKMVGQNIMFALTEGCNKNFDGNFLSGLTRLIRTIFQKIPLWAQWLIGLLLAVAGVALGLIPLL